MKKLPLTLFLLEIVLFMSAVMFFLLKIMQINLEPAQIVFSTEGFDYFIVIILIIIPIFINIFLKRKYPKVYAWHSEITQMYKQKGKEKSKTAKNELKNFFILFGRILRYLGISIKIGVYRIKGRKSKSYQKMVDKKREMQTKILDARNESRLVGLILVELSVIATIIISMYAFFDDGFELIKREVPFHWKALGFVILIGFAIYIHSKTREFRKSRK